MHITFDKITDDITADPDIIFKGLKFKLKKFDFKKDIIFQNMTQIKLDKLTFRMMTYYEFNYDNILDKLEELFPDKIVTISDSMFIQLYLYLIKNKFEKRFIYSREFGQSFDKAMYQGSLQSVLDGNTHMLYIMYINNSDCNRLFEDSTCFYSHCNLIKTGLTKDRIDCFSGLTLDGIKTMTVIEWARYLKSSCAEFFVEKKRSNDIEYESDTRDLCLIENREEFDNQMKIFRIKKALECLNKYLDIGYLDIWEFSNGLTKVAINTEKNMIIDIKD